MVQEKGMEREEIAPFRESVILKIREQIEDCLQKHEEPVRALALAVALLGPMCTFDITKCRVTQHLS